MSDMKKYNSCSDYTGDESISVFLAFAIEQYKVYKGISGTESMEILSKAGVLKYLEEYYDTLHTQGARWLMAEIDDFIQNRNYE